MASQAPPRPVDAPPSTSITSLVDLAYTRGFTLFAAVLLLGFVMYMQWSAMREIQTTQQEIVRTLDRISARLDAQAPRIVVSPTG